MLHGAIESDLGKCTRRANIQRRVVARSVQSLQESSVFRLEIVKRFERARQNVLFPGASKWPIREKAIESEKDRCSIG